MIIVFHLTHEEEANRTSDGDLSGIFSPQAHLQIMELLYSPKLPVTSWVNTLPVEERN